MSVSALLAKVDFFAPLRWAGENTIVVYLAFFLPMAASRAVLLKTGYLDIGTVSLLVTAAGVVTPLMFYWLVKRTKLRFLFARPEMFRLQPRRRMTLQPAE